MATVQVVVPSRSPEADGTPVGLRQAAVLAVVRERDLRERLRRLDGRASWIEERASRALERGDEIAARQILARGLCTLLARDALVDELAAARRETHALVAAMLRTGAPAAGRR